MNVQTAIPAATVDLATITGRQQVAWSSGDYAVVGTTLQIVGESLCEQSDNWERVGKPAPTSTSKSKGA